MKTLTGSSFDHRLESLEGRSLLSGGPDAGAGAAPAHDAAVVVADAGFLNAASEASGATAADDAETYDFGGAWGTQAAGQVQLQVDLNGGAVDQEPGGSMPRITPADVSTVVQQNFGEAAEYNGSAPVITYNTDPVVMDGPAVDDLADAPIINTTELQPPAPPAPAAPMPVAPTSVVGIEWIEIPGVSSSTVDIGAIADQVVIVSTFVTH